MEHLVCPMYTLSRNVVYARCFQTEVILDEKVTGDLSRWEAYRSYV